MLHASHEILEECIRVGGSVTGEHGIGVEKMALMPKLFAPEDLAAMIAHSQRVQPRGSMQPVQDAPQRRPLHRAQEPRAPGIRVMRAVPSCPGPIGDATASFTGLCRCGIMK